MIERAVFYQRLAICRVCEFWGGVCLKGHPLQSPVGCPVKKFDPLVGAGYHPDKPSTVQDPIQTPCCGGAAGDEAVEPLSWSQALGRFTESMAQAQRNGWRTVVDKDYADRLGVCRGCEEYRFFQCRLCKCIVLFKAKLEHETCPRKKWRVLST